MTEWTLTQQFRLLWQSGLLGVGLGFLFTFFNVASKMRRCPFRLFLCDMVFCLLAALVTFYFALAIADGRLHPFLFIGSSLGFLLQHLVIGRFFSYHIYRLLRATRVFWRHIFGAISVVLMLIGEKLQAVCIKLPKNTLKYRKKSKKSEKNS